MYGFDVLIDENLKPWLLEVNVFPSLSSSSPFDKIVKSQLICDVFTLIGLRGYDKQKVHGISREEENRMMLSKTFFFNSVEEPRRSYTVSSLSTSHRAFTVDDISTLSHDEINVMVEYEEESARKG